MWMLPEERRELEIADKLANIYHRPQWEGDYQGILKQRGLLEIFKEVRYAEHEKKPSWDLPGHGNAYAECGKIKTKGCDHVEDHENHKVFGIYYKHNCRRKQCPTCYEGWASAESERALIRFASFVSGVTDVDRLILRLKLEMRDNPKPKKVFHRQLVFFLEKKATARGYRPIHVVLSPPLDTDLRTFSDYRSLRRECYRLAKKHGLYGGAVIFHPYRLKCSECGSAIPDYTKQCPRCQNDEFRWFFSPHFHLVGYGWIRLTKQGYAEHGWIVKNLKARKSIFATFQYLLSHAGVSSFHVTTWFGKLSYRVMRFVPKLGRVLELCPYCHRPLRPLVFIGGEDRPPPELTISDNPLENCFLGDYSDWRNV